MARRTVGATRIPIAQKNISARLFLQHVGKILCPHRGLDMPLHHRLAHNFRCNICGEHCLFGMINRGWVVTQK